MLRVIPVWIKLPNLPLNCWGSDSLSRIGSLLGVPLYADECTSKQMRISFARLLVEIYVTKDLPKSVTIQGPAGIAIVQKVIYEWLPPFCTKCNLVGHVCGKGNGSMTRFQPARQQQKKIVQVWQPKKIVSQPVEEENETETTMEGEVTNLDSNQPTTADSAPVDEGWRVVTRRNREPRNSPSIVGLAQVHEELGMNDPSKVVEIKKFLGNNNVSVVALVETKIKCANSGKIQKKFGNGWRWIMNYSNSPRGRIWVGWKHDMITFQPIFQSDQLIHGCISAKNGKFRTTFTPVYGLHSIETRKTLWNDLTQLS
ncbi:uncharacterized protein [Spinacia oleracea]|uniref:DUF4283 domain-containing protein n=1 Tax=Spinacia oleracea TaxID=3562 RepID=A0A9R0HYZ2_SPIOL|nr:uncharacterized protein LOC110779518 [Spinacia oleracea]